MPETPSLSELVNINPNPGATDPVIDNSHVVDLLNQNARYHAQNVYNKYNQFLENKKELFKNIEEIQKYDVAPQDREILNKQAGDVLKDILKDPAAIMGGKGYDEINGKIAKFRSDSLLSKQNKLDDDTNGMFMDRTPELRTDENNAKRDNFWKAPLGSRQAVQLDLPAIFDEKTAFEGVLKGATNPYTAIVGPDGKPGEGYIESGNEVNPQAIQGAWNLALQGQKDKYGHSILGAVKYNYDKLPAGQKAQYEKNGGVEKYFSDRGKQYIDAYFPKGSYDQTPEGNYRFGKKLSADPNYLGKEKLAQKTANDNARLAIDREELKVKWANYGVAKHKIDKADIEDLSGADTVLNEATNIINNGVDTPIRNSNGTIGHVWRISDPTLLQKFGNIDKDGKVTNPPDFIDYDKVKDQPRLGYYTTKKTKTGANIIDKEIPLDKRTWLKIITARSFPNKEIGGINSTIEDVLQANNNSLYNLSQKNNKQSVPTETPKPAQKQPSTKTTKIKGTKQKLY